jgi:hypothetical protein
MEHSKIKTDLCQTNFLEETLSELKSNNKTQFF